MNNQKLSLIYSYDQKDRGKLNIEGTKLEEFVLQSVCESRGVYRVAPQTSSAIGEKRSGTG